ncbi:MAG: hypothetical protein LBK54_11930 [Propionibacteriaceae bacterium]|jgi:D-methionine transport system substrate-binding protein|nr:hypothetical protein [Propionibacteriaceae bacterium]
MKRRTATRLLLAATAALLIAPLSACGEAKPDPNPSDSTASGALTTLKVGVTAGPAEQILTYAAVTQAKAEGLLIEVKVFTDFTTPDNALKEGELDANLYQHKPFLDNYNSQQNGNLVALDEVYLLPITLYSKRWNAVSEIPGGATISLPNDPSNEARALQLLAGLGLISISDGATTVNDIIRNQHDFEFVELSADTVVPTLDDVDAGVVNFNYALSSGLTNEREPLEIEPSANSPYFVVLATQSGRQSEAAIETLNRILTSPQTVAWIAEEFKGLVLTPGV